MTARTVADLASQVTSVNNSEMTNLLNASTAVVAPFPAGHLKVTVSAVDIDANGVAKVTWSDTRNGVARAVGSTVPLPTALNVPNTQLIWSEASYYYTPAIGYVMTGSVNLADEIYMRPRLSDKVQRPTT